MFLTRPAPGRLGVVIMLLSVIVPVIAVILTAISEGVDAHNHWISQHTPEEQAAIRKAERVAARGAIAAGSVAMHEHHKRVSAQLSASAIGTGPPPGKAGAVMWRAKQRRRAEAESQRRQQELLDAIRQSSQPAPDLAAAEQTAALVRKAGSGS